MKPNKSLIILMIVMMSPLAGMGVDIYTPALPLISDAFHTSIFASGLTMTAYLIGYAFGLSVAGALADSLGRLKVLNICLILYVITTICLIFSPNIHTLDLLRLIQGIAVAGPGVMCKVLISDYFDKKEIPKASSYKSMAWAFGPVIAPFFGGLLSHYFGWSGSFYFLCIYSFILLVMCVLFLNESNPNVIPLHVKTIFKNYCLVLKNKRFIALTLNNAFCYSFFVVFSILGPFIIQKHLGYSPLTFGNSVLAIGLCYFIATILNRVFLNKLSLNQLSKISRIIMGIAFLGLLISGFLPIYNKLTVLITILIFCGLGYFGIGLLFSNSIASCIMIFPNNAGVATAVMNSGFVLGAGVMTFIAGFLPHTSLLPLGIFFVVLFILISLILRQYPLQDEY